MEKLTLYQFEECPFCLKVRVKLDELKIKYEKVNVSYSRDNPLRKKLLKKSGVTSVPVLRIEDKYIGESADIIEYLEQNFNKLN